MDPAIKISSDEVFSFFLKRSFSSLNLPALSVTGSIFFTKPLVWCSDWPEWNRYEHDGGAIKRKQKNGTDDEHFISQQHHMHDGYACPWSGWAIAEEADKEFVPNRREILHVSSISYKDDAKLLIGVWSQIWTGSSIYIDFWLVSRCGAAPRWRLVHKSKRMEPLSPKF
jgi:hypothetical protein